MGAGGCASIPRLRGVLIISWVQTISNRRDLVAYKALCLVDRLRKAPSNRFVTRRCPTFPRADSIEERCLYVTQVRHLRKWVSFRCPGNCGKVVRLRLAPTESPHWTASTDWLGRTTVIPSIRQLNSCFCHFWVRRCRIQWCVDTSRPFPVDASRLSQDRDAGHLP